MTYRNWEMYVNREAVKVIVMNYLKNIGPKSVFKYKEPGVDWMYEFEKHWKNQLTYRAYACNKSVVADFFKKLKTVLDRIQLVHRPRRPQNIFNVDETGVQADVSSQRCSIGKKLRIPKKQLQVVQS